MRFFKLARVVQIILVTILVITVGTIIVAILSNYEAMAVQTICSQCGNMVSWEYMDEATHSYTCNNKDCVNFVRSDHVCESWTPRKNVSNEHSGYCIYCECEVTTSCYDNNRDNFCDICGREGGFGVKTECSQCTNPVVWEYMDEIQHSYTCRNCINFVTGNHSWITTISSNEDSSETHIASKVCSFCGYLAKQEYVACYDNNSDGICDACGRVGMHVHNYTEKECTQNDSDTHIVTLKCSCGATQNGGTEKHTGATHENGGKCTANGCGYQYEIHKNSNILCGYSDITDAAHTPIYKCTTEGCNKTFKGAPENHDYKNGKCVCGKESLEIKIESEIYKIDDKYVSKVIPKQTVNTVKNNIKVSGAEINIYDKDDNLIQGITRVGTGARVEIKNENETKNFIVIVNGDVNGDAGADFKDIVKMNQARLNKEKLDDIYSLAADVNGDGKVDFKDIVKINQFRLNKIKEL